MTTESSRRNHSVNLYYIAILVSLLGSQELACAVDTQSPETIGKQSEPIVAAASTSANSTPTTASTVVRPDRAVQVPRSAALQAHGPIMVVSHQGIGAVPNTLMRGVQ